MAKGVFVHRADSKYDDFPEEQYQFPKRYLKRAREFVQDWIVYYEPRGGGGRLGYTGIARVQAINPDPDEAEMFIAHIEPRSFVEFEEFVPLRSSTGFWESELKKPDGTLNGGKIQWAIRPISDSDFNTIVSYGFPDEEVILPRIGLPSEPASNEVFSDDGVEFDHDFERTRVEQTISRIPRHRVFRRHVLEAYGSRCAMTGLKLINGQGRAEVEAAHIKPVAENGPDTVRNGIALSGTVHWMFDRGLISLSDDLDILLSRQVNDPDRISSLINSSGKAIPPIDPALRPHPKYLDWHREYCFKQ